MSTYNIGIIGYGGFGKFLHHWWEKLDHACITAISDIRKPQLKDSNIEFFPDWKDLIKNDNVDIVSIVTPPAFHAEMACEAMLQGKHVLLEKPIAVNLEDAGKILNIRKKTGRAATVNHMLRYHPMIDALVRLTKQGTFGELRHVVVNNYAQDSSLDPSHWFWDQQISGGILIEHGVHFIDLVHAFTDSVPVHISGCAHNRNERQQDQVAATVLYENGLIAQHYHSFARPGFFEKTALKFVYDLAEVETVGWIPETGKIEALVNSSTKSFLSNLPGWKLEKVQPIRALEDRSRPEGWGEEASEMKKEIRSGGISYEVDEWVAGTFGLSHTKSEIYGKCLQDILSDLIMKIEFPGHQMKITLEDALKSLEIALVTMKE